ncbi:MAG TPA: PEGA domain-containing protein [Methanoregula sp.]|nr:PEGA domain-containing protein [Methanoregula sp.]
MSWSDSFQEQYPHLVRRLRFLIFMQIFFGILFLIISPVHAAADTNSVTDPHSVWVKSFEQTGNAGSYTVIATSDGGSVTSGSSISSPGLSDIYVIKTDPDGNKIWDFSEKASPYEIHSIVETQEKGYVIAGTANSTVMNGIFLLKLDPSGKKTWTHTFNKSEYYSKNYISMTRDGGFIVVGSMFGTNSSPSSLWDVYILKTDSEGKELWTGFFMGQDNDFASSVSQTEDGGYIIAGTTESYVNGSGPHSFLLKMTEFGNKEWFTTYENGPGNEKPSVIQTPDGGYILLATSLPNTSNQQSQDLFLVRTDDRGKELWNKTISGMGGAGVKLLIQEAESIAVVTGSYGVSEPEKTREIIVINFNMNGIEERNRTFSIGKPLDVQDISVAKGGYFIAGVGSDEGNLQKKDLTIIKVLDTPFDKEGVVKNSFELTIVAKDIKTGSFIGGANVYIDGNSVGSTSDQDGKQILRDVEGGSHTIRVAKTEYDETTRYVYLTEKRQVSVTLGKSKVIPLRIHGSTDEKIDVVFVASETSFNCNSKTKIRTEIYSGDQQRFIGDVNNKIDHVFLSLDTLTTGSQGLPKDFRERFNFYYYWDPISFADAFDGCAGSLPQKFWNDAPFTDVAIILYPSYEGFYSGSPCEPNGCANGLGPGSGSWLKAPADSPMIFLHESGHVVFGLIDTYCGDTYYVENSPFPNVWDSENACKENARQESWDSASCRQIFKPAGSRSKDPCVKNFWRVDPDPDIMGSGAYSGRFGNASTLHIRLIFDTINRWQK